MIFTFFRNLSFFIGLFGLHIESLDIEDDLLASSEVSNTSGYDNFHYEKALKCAIKEKIKEDMVYDLFELRKFPKTPTPEFQRFSKCYLRKTKLMCRGGKINWKLYRDKKMAMFSSDAQIEKRVNNVIATCYAEEDSEGPCIKAAKTLQCITEQENEQGIDKKSEEDRMSSLKQARDCNLRENVQPYIFLHMKKYDDLFAETEEEKCAFKCLMITEKIVTEDGNINWEEYKKSYKGEGLLNSNDLEVVFHECIKSVENIGSCSSIYEQFTCITKKMIEHTLGADWESLFHHSSVLK